ncbi:response regulator [Novosphingobium sp. Fuku2-ISO-50]|uniref:response regulator n=1 Tax=Novosphingobium sp. Fuku2-ISO-50 TaxID=1739114 RepID=UPI0009E68855|nr:response regulator [Novosphingobium sp. Fuku2-ISO-50]
MLPDKNVETARSKRSSILLVDDDELVLAMLAARLTDFGYHVVQADCGKSALALLDAGEEVGLLVSDLSMTGMNGISLINETHTRNHNPRVGGSSPSSATIFQTKTNTYPFGKARSDSHGLLHGHGLCVTVCDGASRVAERPCDTTDHRWVEICACRVVQRGDAGSSALRAVERAGRCVGLIPGWLSAGGGLMGPLVLDQSSRAGANMPL